jgi:hypothetical protein
MLSRSAPSNQGSRSLTPKRRASIPSVPSMISAASPSHSARSTSPSAAARTISSASTAPVAV